MAQTLYLGRIISPPQHIYAKGGFILRDFIVVGNYNWVLATMYGTRVPRYVIKLLTTYVIRLNISLYAWTEFNYDRMKI